MRLLVGVAAIALGGCASVTDIREKPVAATFGSNRSVAELSTCLAGVLSQPKGAMVKTVPIERGVLLAESAPINFGSTVTNTTEIEDLGATRKVTVRSVATYKPKDVDRLRAAYGPCLLPY